MDLPFVNGLCVYTAKCRQIFLSPRTPNPSLSRAVASLPLLAQSPQSPHRPARALLSALLPRCNFLCLLFAPPPPPPPHTHACRPGSQPGFDVTQVAAGQRRVVALLSFSREPGYWWRHTRSSNEILDQGYDSHGCEQHNLMSYT